LMFGFSGELVHHVLMDDVILWRRPVHRRGDVASSGGNGRGGGGGCRWLRSGAAAWTRLAWRPQRGGTLNGFAGSALGWGGRFDSIWLGGVQAARANSGQAHQRGRASRESTPRGRRAVVSRAMSNLPFDQRAAPSSRHSESRCQRLASAAKRTNSSSAPGWRESLERSIGPASRAAAAAPTACARWAEHGLRHRGRAVPYPASRDVRVSILGAPGARHRRCSHRRMFRGTPRDAGTARKSGAPGACYTWCAHRVRYAGGAGLSSSGAGQRRRRRDGRISDSPLPCRSRTS
jgi:hypothetical protein